jgi:hypothetical protein
MDGWDLATVWFIHRAFVRSTMAKSDSFFIRAKVAQSGSNAYLQTAVDLGAYVDALGKSVLRIHNVAVQIYDSSPTGSFALAGANTQASVNYQLTTQSQSGIVGASDRSVIATGRLDTFNASAVPNSITGMSQDSDILPQMWTNGYLVGVEQIYLAVDPSAAYTDIAVEIVLECTVETLSQSGAMALALSQQ